MTAQTGPDKKYLFTSNRLIVSEYLHLIEENEVKFATKVMSLLSPKVVKPLPDEWQGVNTVTKTINWLEDRKRECALYLISAIHSDTIIGLLFIYPLENTRSLHLGYLIGEDYWNKGYASEMLLALVAYYKEQAHVDTLIAGVEKTNIASIKVLEKCGFKLSENTSSAGSIFYEKRLNLT